MNKSIFTLFLLFFFAGTSVAVAQSFKYNKVLGKPNAFNRPYDNDAFYLSKIKDHTEAPWVVFCDRSDEDLIKTYTKSGGGQEFKKVKYKDHYYVVEETPEWIHIVKANVTGNLRITPNTGIDFGWIMKRNMLLWNSGLVDSRTQIHRKAFMLNKASETAQIIKLEKKELVKILKGPYTGETVGDKTIYEFYFVYKKENNRYLLCKEVEVAPGNMIQSNLIGWVDASRLEDWNTRIALEPNYTEAAFNERKSNDKMRVVAYGYEEGAKRHSEEGIIKNDQVFWDNDPIKIPKEQMAQTDPYRFKGAVVRFPMFGSVKSYYRSGVIGEVTIKTLESQLEKMQEINYAGISQSVRNSETARDNYNILFVVEATQGMIPYKSGITEGLKEIKEKLASVPNVRFGAALYRDTPEREAGRLFQVKQLTNNLREVQEFVETAEFKSPNDNDDYTAMNYGLNQALLEAGMSSDATNLVFLVGNNGDFSGDKVRRVTAQEANDEALLKSNSVADQLAKLNVHLIAVQPKNANNRESVKYVSGARTFILEAAKQQHDRYKGVTDYLRDVVLENPTVTEGEGNDPIILKGGPTVGRVIKPQRGSALNNDDITQAVLSGAKDVYEFTESFWQMIGRVVDEGASIDDISSGTLQPAVAQVIFNLIDESSDSGEWSKEDIEKLAKNKYKLYTEVYIPVSVPNAKYPPVSKVLFMPRLDLEGYARQLESLSLSLIDTPDKQREALYNTMVNLLKQFTGNDNINPKDYSVEQLRQVMQGVEKEGLAVSSGEVINFPIEDIRSKRKMPDADIRSFIQRILDNTRKLNSILRKGKSYEFSYTSGRDMDGNENIYFWIPVEYTF